MSNAPRLRRSAPRPERPAPDEPAPRPRDRMFVVSLAVALATVLGGCSLLGLGSDGESDSSGGQDGSTIAGEGAEWFWYQQGQRAASPAAPALPAPTTGGPITVTVPGTPAQPPYSGRPYCLGRLRADTMYWLNATPGVGQASVSWMSLGDPRIVEYKIAAVLQNRPGGSVPPATWTTVPKPNGCQQMNATVTGLTRGNWYVFWLDVVVTTLPTGRREPMIGRSPAFLVQ
ncbi:hypothetical protein [Virgisporangium ochraceum]|uniref:hypothetical protein n=1 Tax=Virgisporangium ochraceum TaxID=65505 RepID=UPI00194277B1|nr:hypothetical protein [Virgisporangium ochraceum]